MKRLNAFLDILQQQQQQQLKHQQSPLNLTFYLRKRIADGFDPNIVKVSVQLKDGDVRTQLVKLLKLAVSIHFGRKNFVVIVFQSRIQPFSPSFCL